MEINKIKAAIFHPELGGGVTAVDILLKDGTTIRVVDGHEIFLFKSPADPEDSVDSFIQAIVAISADEFKSRS